MPENEKGEELIDPVPAHRSIDWARPPTLQDQIRRLVDGELSRRAAAAGAETFEEADDFEVGEDYDPRSPHELRELEELPRWQEKPEREAAITAAEEKLVKRLKKAPAKPKKEPEEPEGDPEK